MRAVVQRVSRGRVTVGDEEVGQIGLGLAVLVGVGHADTIRDVDYLVDKLVHLRIFADEAGKMNRSLLEVGGALLLVSQFTLHGDCRKGRRPSFIAAARPEQAQQLLEQLLAKLRALGVPTATGRFGAAMQVELINDGPVTLFLESPAEHPPAARG